MRKSAYLHALLLGAGILLAASGAVAQDRASVIAGKTTITVGGGVQLLKLPDIDFSFFSSATSGAALNHQRNSDLDDYGGAASGSIETPLGFWGTTPVTGIVSGFYANIEDSDRRSCTSSSDALCTVENIVDHPNSPDSFTADSFSTKTHRDVDFWGTGVEARFGKRRAPAAASGGYLFRFAYAGFGADVRGIDQTNTLKLDLPGAPNPVVRYDETLDTTYWGGYLTLAGEYDVLSYFGIGKSWGLRSLVAFRAGLYDADTDYRGRYSAGGPATPLSLSDGHTTFIGGASFETRKQFGPRTSLSLLTDYEYYSFAPEMRYVDADRGGCTNSPGGPLVDCPGNIARTHITDDDAFAVRSTLRLNIGLGPRTLYAPPMK
jgi:hypothetical protein